MILGAVFGVSLPWLFRLIVELGGRDAFLWRWRHPFAALPRGDAHDIHHVHFLQGLALALENTEVHDQNRGEETAREHISIGEIDFTTDEGSEEADQEVPEPVGSRGHGHRPGSIARGVDLGDDGPDHRTPRGGVASDEQTGKDHHRLASPGSRRGVLEIQREVPDGGVDHETNEHPDGPGDERLATAEMLDDIEASKGGAEVHTTQDHLRDVAVADTGAVEHSCAVVEEVVCSGQLLQRLKKDSKDDAIQHPGGPEHLIPRLVLGSHLSVELLLDLRELLDDHAMIRVDSVELRHGVLGLLNPSMPEIKPRTLGE